VVVTELHRRKQDISWDPSHAVDVGPIDVLPG
jgi:hypothetical protein